MGKIQTPPYHVFATGQEGYFGSGVIPDGYFVCYRHLSLANPDQSIYPQFEVNMPILEWWIETDHGTQPIPCDGQCRMYITNPSTPTDWNARLEHYCRDIAMLCVFTGGALIYLIGGAMR
jgi:hypothetical protein